MDLNDAAKVEERQSQNALFSGGGRGRDYSDHSAGRTVMTQKVLRCDDDEHARTDSLLLW